MFGWPAGLDFEYCGISVYSSFAIFSLTGFKIGNYSPLGQFFEATTGLNRETNYLLSSEPGSIRASIVAWAQFEAGSVIGVITDLLGSVVAEASIELRSLATGVVRRTSSSSAGEFDFVAVSGGDAGVGTQ